MKIKHTAMRWIWQALLVIIAFPLGAQIPGGAPLKSQDIVEIPFRYENHFILIDLIFNERLPLTFIFDTGAENTIVTQRQVTDMLGVQYRKEFRIIGSDMRTELIAYLVQDVDFRMGPLALRKQQALVLEDDYFRFEEYTGTKIHGILGANIFRHYVVKIDYRRKIITFQKPNTFKGVSDEYLSAPLEVRKNKPYLFNEVLLPDGTQTKVKLLVDTGASLALLFNLGTHPEIQLPENAVPGNIGKGLGGYLEGYLGFVDSLFISDLIIEGVPVNYQELLPEMDTSFLNGRNGILGNQIMEKFTIIIDYIRGDFYLKPNKYFDREFEKDRSGLTLIATGPSLSEFIIQYVQPGSPGAEAGLQEGDQILKVNWLPRGLLGLGDITHIFSKKPGKKIKLKIKREGKRIKTSFILRDYITTGFKKANPKE